MRRITTEEYLEFTRQYVAQRAQPFEPEEVIISGCHGGRRRRIQLLLPGQLAPEASSPCAAAILDTLREVGRRLTGAPLRAALAEHGHEYSERKIAGELARLVRDGELTNDPDADPPGYGLPDW